MKERVRYFTSQHEKQGPEEEFNSAQFVQTLLMMDLQYKEAVMAIHRALVKNNEDQILKLRKNKTDLIKTILKFLANAYIATDGEIANFPEFNFETDRAIRLSIPYEGIALWVEVGKMVEKIERVDFEEERAEIAADAERVIGS